MTGHTGKRILVVDDDPSFRELLTAFLDQQGYEVESAADGGETLKLLRSESTDLVLLDLEWHAQSVAIERGQLRGILRNQDDPRNELDRFSAHSSLPTGG